MNYKSLVNTEALSQCTTIACALPVGQILALAHVIVPLWYLSPANKSDTNPE